MDIMKEKIIKRKYYVIGVLLLLVLPPIFISYYHLVNEQVALSYVIVLENKNSIYLNRSISEANQLNEFVDVLTKNNKILVLNQTKINHIIVDENYISFFLVIHYVNNNSDTIFIDNIGNLNFNDKDVLFQNKEKVISIFNSIRSIIDQ